MPAASRTARTPPAAITPVPGEAGLSRTRAPPTLPSHFVRNGCAHHADLAHILVSAFGCFAHGIGHSIGFANAQAHFAVVITSHDGHPELETAATFHNFGHTGDFDHALVKLLFQRLDIHSFP